MNLIKQSFFMFLTIFCLSAWASEKPNVIVILVDDQGYYDLSCYGATEVSTPRIDQLAKEGVRFTDYYSAAPICSPSRAGLLTGCYPKRIGMETWVHRADSDHGIHPDERTLGELYQAHGYQTACIGKWHLGDREPFKPRRQGFDYYYGLMHNLDPIESMFFEEEGGVPIVRNGEVVKRPADPSELTKLYTDEAIRFIDEQGDKPFFIYLPHTMLHVPLGVSPEFVGSSKFGEYGDAIQEMDHHVGRLVDHLKTTKLDKKTIVVYISDNGRGPGRHASQPLQGRKLSTYEAGIRVPSIVWGPGVGIQPKVSSDIVNAMDLYPSLASLSGIKVPGDRILDGRDLSKLMQGKANSISECVKTPSLNSHVGNLRPWSPPLEWSETVTKEEYFSAYFYHGSHGALSAVRFNDYKLYLNPKLTLYNLKKDPGETKPVRDKVHLRKLRGMAVLFQDEMRTTGRKAGYSTIKETSPKLKKKLPKTDNDKVESYLDLPYAKYGDRVMELNLFRPRSAAKDLPAMVCIHGGGWLQGSRTHFNDFAKFIALRGFVVVSIDYRLSGEAKFPAAIHDCKAAVRWLRANADKYGLDPNKIGAIGSSAGGHLAALLGSSAGVPELEGLGGNQNYSSKIQVALPWAAQTDLTTERIQLKSEETTGKMFYSKFLGGTYKTHRAQYKLASPIEFLDRNDPPFYFMCGELDDPSTRANAFREKLTKLGIPSNLKVLNGAPHGFHQNQAWFNEALNNAISFAQIHLADK